MLAALLFAADDADDSPDLLAATLPIGGTTLIEFQTRLAIAAGASQIVIMVGRVTPELLGAVNRIMKLGVPVDTVRSAIEASERLHPLTRVLVIADGMVTSDAVIATLPVSGGDALLVTQDADALPGLERVGADAIWAGLASLSVRRIAEVARLPRDYDFQSTLLRVAAQAGADHIALPAGPARLGHGVERSAAALRARNQALLDGHVASRPAWFDRYVVAPIARYALPRIVARDWSSMLVGGVSGAVMAAGLGAIAWGWQVAGLAMVVAATIGLATSAALSWMRDEPRSQRAQQRLSAGGAIGSVLLLALADGRATGTGTALALAAALCAAAAMIARAEADDRRLWWASPAAYPLLMLVPAAVSQVTPGLAVAAAYAAATLAAMIEALRQKALARI